MSDKRCSTCRSRLPLEAFALSRRARDGRQARCRACWRSWYAEHREERIALVDRRRAEVRAAHQERLIEHLLANPCVDCGETDLRVLDFDHEDPAGKVADVARLASMNIAWARIAAEIAMCSVRCANCHRRRTAEQLGYWRQGAEERRRAARLQNAEARLITLTGAGGTLGHPPRT